MVVVDKTSIHWVAATDKKNCARLVHEGLLNLYLAMNHKANALNNFLRSAVHWVALAYPLLLDLIDETDTTSIHHATEEAGGEAVRVFVAPVLGQQHDQEGRTPLM